MNGREVEVGMRGVGAVWDRRPTQMGQCRVGAGDGFREALFPRCDEAMAYVAVPAKVFLRGGVCTGG